MDPILLTAAAAPCYIAGDPSPEQAATKRSGIAMVSLRRMAKINGRASTSLRVASCAAMAAILMGFCPPAQADLRQSGIWVAYNGLVYRESFQVEGNHVVQNADDGGIPEFAVRLPATEAGATGGPSEPRSAGPPAVEIAPDFLVNPAAARGGRLLLAISELSLPLVRPTGEGHDASVRHVASDIDLLADRTSPAANLCRGLEPQAVPAATADRCRIEATIDASDNWPVEATISRTLSAANRTQGTHSITFRRRIAERQ